MCVAVGKYFPSLGWCVAKNRDRNYDLAVSFDERTTEDGLDVLVYRDDVTGYTEGLNSNGVAVVSTALLVLDDEKEAEKERERKLSKDGQKLNRALEFATAREAARYLVEAELSGHTLVADRRHLYHLEADKHDGEYEWHLREVPHDETVAVTNHGLRFPEAGYQLPGEKGRSSRARLRVARRLVEEARSPRELLDSLVGSYASDPANNVARTATDSSKLRTTAQVLLVPGERTVYFRPVTSSLTFDYFRLNNPKSKVWLEVLSQRPLYEAHDAEANGKSKLKHRLRQAVKRAVAKGAEVEANYSEFTGGFSPKAALLAKAKQALLLEFSTFSEDEKWEFTRCVRPDGSAYGSRGRCVKGVEQEKEQLEKAKKFASGVVKDWVEDAEYDPKLKAKAEKLALQATLAAESNRGKELNEAVYKLGKLTGVDHDDLDDPDAQDHYEGLYNEFAAKLPQPKTKEFAKGLEWPDNPTLRDHLNNLSSSDKKELATEVRELRKLAKDRGEDFDFYDKANDAAGVLGAWADRPLKGKYGDGDGGLSDDFFDHQQGRSAARLAAWAANDPDLERGGWNYSEGAWDFTTCARSDGSLYGTAGRCRKGKEVSEDQAALQRAANRKRKSGRYGGTLKQRVARDATANHLGAQHRELEKKHRAAKRRFDKAADELENDRWNATKRDNYKKAERESNAAFTAAERARARLKRRLQELTQEHQSQNTKAPSRKKSPDFPENWPTGRQLR